MPLTNQPDADALSVMPIHDLYAYRNEVADRLAEVKTTLAQIDASLNARFADHAKKAYAAAEKEGGSVIVGLNAGIRIKADRSKKVTWNQGALRAVASTLTWPEVEHLFKIEFAVPEAKFNALMPGDLRTKIEAARSVTYGDTKITLEAVE